MAFVAVDRTHFPNKNTHVYVNPAAINKQMFKYFSYLGNLVEVVQWLALSLRRFGYSAVRAIGGAIFFLFLYIFYILVITLKKMDNL